MSRVFAAVFAKPILAVSIPTVAFAGCYSCYTPQPRCYQQQVAPPQYRTVQETVMVARAASSPIARRRSIAP